MSRTITSRLTAALATAVITVAVAAPAQADTFTVACGDVAGLNAAITSANATAAADTIELGPGSPCTYTLTSAAAPGAGGNDTGLPIVTHDLTINGHGATIARSTASGTPNFRVIFVNGAVALNLRDLTISGGKLTGGSQHGAGIASLASAVSLDHVTVSGNGATGGTGGTASGGGGMVAVGGSVLIDHSNFQFNAAVKGGGMWSVAAATTVRRSDFVVNGATSSTGAVLVQGGATTFENDTIAFNGAPNGIGGLAVIDNGASTPGRADVDSSTFADNSTAAAANVAPGGSLWAGVFSVGGAASIHVRNTIVTDTDSTATPALAPCATFNGATIVSDGGNLEHPTATCPFATHADPKLAAIALSGGTYSYRLLPASPAIDLGGATCPATDQRDHGRPDGAACDSGAYETDPPDTTASGPAAPTNAPKVAFTADQGAATFECRVDGGAWSACTSPYAPAGLPDGSHTAEVRATSSDGYTDPTPASVAFTVDATPPVVTIAPVASPTDDPNVDVSFAADDATSSFTCQVDGGTQAACRSPYTTARLADGTHTITVRAADAAGNTGSAHVDVVVATQAPDTAITSGPTGTIRSASATFSFVADPPAGATFQCRLDAGAWTGCTSPATVSFAPGAHTFSVRATGPTGLTDPSPPSRAFTYQKCTVGLGSICI